MIVATEDLEAYRGRVTMVDGGFDPLHPGHVAYFEAAAALGRPVLCNVAPDDWVARKHPPLLPQADRATLVDAIRYVDYVHLASGTTASVLRALVPAAYAKGDEHRRYTHDDVFVHPMAALRELRGLLRSARASA